VAILCFSATSIIHLVQKKQKLAFSPSLLVLNGVTVKLKNKELYLSAWGKKSNSKTELIQQSNHLTNRVRMK